MKMPRLSARERALALLVGAAVFLLITLLLLNFLFRQHARLRNELSQKQTTWQATQTLFGEREMWERRDLWLQQNHPRLENPGSAGVQLLDQIKQAAKENGVQLENPAIGTPETGEFYQSVPVTLETKSQWHALIRFLHSLQSPEKFVVLESANLQIDAGDPTQMRGRFRIAKWYAP
jgi:Tfp pilus assembly protein PilO